MKANAFRIAVMPGEGIGVEVMAAALAVLDAVENRFGVTCRRETIPGGAHLYQETGRIRPPGRDPVRRHGVARHPSPGRDRNSAAARHTLRFRTLRRRAAHPGYPRAP